MSQRTLLFACILFYVLFMLWLLTGCTNEPVKNTRVINITQIEATSQPKIYNYQYEVNEGVCSYLYWFIDSANKYHVGLNEIK